MGKNPPAITGARVQSTASRKTPHAEGATKRMRQITEACVPAPVLYNNRIQGAEKPARCSQRKQPYSSLTTRESPGTATETQGSQKQGNKTFIRSLLIQQEQKAAEETRSKSLEQAGTS